VIICRYQDSSRVRLIESIYLDAALLYEERKGPPLRFALLSHWVCLNSFLRIYVIVVLFITLLNNITGNAGTIIYKLYVMRAR